MCVQHIYFLFSVINTGSGPAVTQVELSTPPTTTPAPSPGDAQLQSLQDKVCILITEVI